jgi:cytochrome b subunit of formate dehydrogenase
MYAHLARGMIGGIIQLLLPMLMFYYLFLPYSLGIYDTEDRLWICLMLLALVNLFLTGFVARLLLRPEAEMRCEVPKSGLLAMNAELIRLVPFGSRRWREQEVNRMCELHAVEVYSGNKRYILVGLAVSLVVLISIVGGSFGVLTLLRLRAQTRLALLSGLGVFGFNVILVGMLSAFRHYWRKTLFPLSESQVTLAQLPRY